MIVRKREEEGGGRRWEVEGIREGETVGRLEDGWEDGGKRFCSGFFFDTCCRLELILERKFQTLPVTTRASRCGILLVCSCRLPPLTSINDVTLLFHPPCPLASPPPLTLPPQLLTPRS
jgi:hypothetical protein